MSDDKCTKSHNNHASICPASQGMSMFFTANGTSLAEMSTPHPDVFLANTVLLIADSVVRKMLEK